MLAAEQRALIRMPEVTGMPLRKAKLLIENAGLELDAILFAESYEERNIVLAQKPSRGQMIYKGEKVSLTVSRESYVKWLPSIYQRSDVTGRNFLRDMLWITQHLFGDIEDVLDVIHVYFDPHEAPEEFLPWLASWMAMVLEEDWPTEKKRKLTKKAIELYKLRGTVKGLKLFISLFTGHEPEIIENDWPFRGCRIGVTSLVGIDTIILPPVNRSHTFLVEMPVTYKDVSIEAVIRLHEIIQMEKPAHTSYCLRFLAEERPAELREFFAIGARSGIGIRDEVVQPLPAGGLPKEEPAQSVTPADTPAIESVAEFMPLAKAKLPLPKAPRADNAPVEGQEVRTSEAGGFGSSAREMRAISIEELQALGLLGDGANPSGTDDPAAQQAAKSETTPSDAPEPGDPSEKSKAKSTKKSDKSKK